MPEGVPTELPQSGSLANLAQSADDLLAIEGLSSLGIQEDESGALVSAVQYFV
jgi:hypothetical protein